MIPRKIIRYFSYFIYTLILLPLVIGCSQRPQPKAWVSVEKPPMRVIFVDNEHDIHSDTVHRLVNQIKGIKFEDIDFNSETMIGIQYDADWNAHQSSSNSVEIK